MNSNFLEGGLIFSYLLPLLGLPPKWRFHPICRSPHRHAKPEISLANIKITYLSYQALHYVVFYLPTLSVFGPNISLDVSLSHYS